MSLSFIALTKQIVFMRTNVSCVFLIVNSLQKKVVGEKLKEKLHHTSAIKYTENYVKFNCHLTILLLLTN